MKKLLQDAFFKECVVKLGSIYILLVVLGYIFLDYRSGQGMSWANGIVFANQPDIVYGQSVNQSPVSLTHTNYTTYAYGGTPSPTIQVTAQFSNVTQEEHEYTQGVV